MLKGSRKSLLLFRLIGFFRHSFSRPLILVFITAFAVQKLFHDFCSFWKFLPQILQRTLLSHFFPFFPNSCKNQKIWYASIASSNNSIAFFLFPSAPYLIAVSISRIVVESKCFEAHHASPSLFFTSSLKFFERSFLTAL